MSTTFTATPAPSSTTTPTVPCAGIPNLDFTGLNGTVCAISIPPSELNISSCCTGALRIDNDCTQYCEADEGDFRDCLSERNNGTFQGSLCQPVNGTEGEAGNVFGSGMNGGAALRPIFGTGVVGVVLSLAFMAALF